MEFRFTLRYSIAANGAEDDLVERLAAAGCNDALIGIGQPGRIALEFTREAENALAALTSAMADVKRAIPSAQLIDVSNVPSAD